MNWNRSVSSPDKTRAWIMLQGPGMAVKGIFCSMQAEVSFCPGSLMQGVPASEIRAKFLPF